MGEKVRERNARCFVTFPLECLLLPRPRFIAVAPPSSRRRCRPSLSPSLPYPLSPDSRALCLTLPLSLPSLPHSPALSLLTRKLHAPPLDSSPPPFPRFLSPLPSLSWLASSLAPPLLATVAPPSPHRPHTSLFPSFPLSLFPLLSLSQLTSSPAPPALFPSPFSPPSPSPLSSFSSSPFFLLILLPSFPLLSSLPRSPPLAESRLFPPCGELS